MCNHPKEFTKDAFTKNLIRKKAEALIEGTTFSRSDRDDIEQEFWMQLLRRKRSFDPAKGHWRAFVTTVVKSHAVDLAKERTAKKRDYRRTCSMGTVVAKEDEREIRLADTVGGDAHDGHLGRVTPNDTRLVDLRLDVKETIASLSTDQRELARALMSETVAEIARRTGIPESTIRSRIRKIRERFERAGLREYLDFSSRSRRAGS